jgi:hypothetical protein
MLNKQLEFTILKATNRLILGNVLHMTPVVCFGYILILLKMQGIELLAETIK